MKTLTEDQREFYYQNIRNYIMEDNGYDEDDMDDEGTEDFVNREADKMFESIFKEEY
jgi:hypothetical protein